MYASQWNTPHQTTYDYVLKRMVSLPGGVPQLILSDTPPPPPRTSLRPPLCRSVGLVQRSHWLAFGDLACSSHFLSRRRRRARAAQPPRTLLDLPASIHAQGGLKDKPLQTHHVPSNGACGKRRCILHQAVMVVVETSSSLSSPADKQQRRQAQLLSHHLISTCNVGCANPCCC